jgi:hypothetical protein
MKARQTKQGIDLPCPALALRYQAGLYLHLRLCGLTQLLALFIALQGLPLYSRAATPHYPTHISASISETTHFVEPLPELNSTSTSRHTEAAPTVQRLELNDDETLIVQVEHLEQNLSEGFLIYHQPNYTLIPLIALAEVLQFALEGDADRELFEGWFRNEKTTLFLDFKNQQYYKSGRPIKLNYSNMIANDGYDLYVELKDAESLFNIKLDLVINELKLLVSSDIPLPIALELERKRKRLSLSNNKAQQPDAKEVPNRYHWYAWPSSDIQYGLGNRKNDTISEYQLISNVDLLQHQFHLVANGGNQQTDRNRLTIKRKARSPTRFIPDFAQESALWTASEYELADITTQSDNLVASTMSGLGLAIRRDSVDGGDHQFGSQSINGNAPPGWEIELYRNGMLVDFTNASEAGQYLFSDVPLQYGENIFDIKIYGPQGQLREDRKRLNIGQTQLKKGNFDYYLMAINPDRFLFNNPEDKPDTEGYSQQKTQNSAYAANLYYGLSTRHSIGLAKYQLAPKTTELTADSARPSTTTQAQQYHKVSWQASWPGVSSNMEYARQKDAGHAASSNISTRLWGHNLGLKHNRYHNFSSQRNHNDQTHYSSEINLFGNQRWGDTPINYSIRYTEDHLKTHQENRQITNRVSSTIMKYRITNELSHLELSGANSPPTAGQLNVNFPGLAHQIRTDLFYTIDSHARAQANIFNTTYNKRIKTRQNLQLKTNLGLASGTTSSLSANYTHRFDEASVSVSTSYNSKHQHEIMLDFNFSLYKPAYAKKILLKSQAMTTKGQLKARVFIDENEDGEYNKGELALEGVKFKGRAEWKTRASDVNGFITLENINADSPTLAYIDESSLGNPFLRPISPGYMLNTHGGGYSELAVPVVFTTEIEGQAWLQRGDDKRPAAGIKLSLINQDGETITSTTTEFDGLFFFSFIRPGDYTVVADKESLGNKYIQQSDIHVRTNNEDGISYTDDLVIKRIGDKSSDN